MSEFCVKCLELESQLELMRNNFYKELEQCKQRIERLKQENDKLKDQNDRLALDLAFYNKDIPDLTFNNK